MLKAAGAIKVLSGDAKVSGNVLSTRTKGIQVVQVRAIACSFSTRICSKIEELEAAC